MTETAVVFGATSYVGSTLTRKLLERGDRVVAVSRRPAIARILLPEQSENLSIAAAEDVAGLTRGEDVSIVNFAYVKDAPPQLLYRQNKTLVTAIGEVAAGRLPPADPHQHLGGFRPPAGDEPRPVTGAKRPRGRSLRGIEGPCRAPDRGASRSSRG